MSSTSVTELEKFLQYLGTKGLLTPAAAASRRAAVGKLFAVLSEDERNDVFVLDIDQVVNRFTNLHGKEYRPGSLQAYISRVKSSLEDFQRYVNDPVNFKMLKSSSSNGAKSLTSGPSPTKRPKQEESTPQGHQALAMTVSEAVFPIPIRENVTVKIYGLPFDLSEGEANKIAAVIKAMAM